MNSASEQAEETEAGSELDSVTRAEAEFPSSKPKVLLVDDDTAVREALGSTLESEGYQVYLAANARQAQRQFALFAPDLVLLDLNMEGKDGWSAFEQMEKYRPFVPVIIITARPGQYDRAVAAGVDALMEKPLNLPLLLAAIQHFLKEPRSQRIARLTHREFRTLELPGDTPDDSRPFETLTSSH